jgi:hypothetical protein
MKPIVESLETRRLLSAAVVPHGQGVMLDVNANEAFTQSLGDFVGISTTREAKFNITALVHWGDGSAASAGAVAIDSSGNITVSGSHAYSNAGKFAVTVAIKGAVLNKSGQPTTNVVALGMIKSSAIAAQSNSSGGVTINEVPGVSFTTSVGTFITIAPATHLHASINWGDGSSSTGTLKSDGVIGLDEIQFEVDGTHTYAKAGTYPIVATVTRSFGPTPTATPIQLVATIDSTAIVAASSAVNLNGTITGTYSLAPTANPDIGATTVFNGTGTAGDLGAVSVHATVTVPGFVATGNATGTLTLTRVASSAAGAGSVTLALTGPTQAGFGSVPSTLSYTITGGTGVDAGATGSGTIAVTMGPGNAFTFIITSA